MIKMQTLFQQMLGDTAINEQYQIIAEKENVYGQGNYATHDLNIINTL